MPLTLPVLLTITEQLSEYKAAMSAMVGPVGAADLHKSIPVWPLGSVPIRLGV